MLLEVNERMGRELKVPAGIDENGHFVEQVGSPEEKLRGYKRVVDSMMRDALRAWTEIWEEFQDTVVTRSGFVLPEAEKGFRPSCGWPEFMERMWLLKHQLDFTERLCRGPE
jgi:hypothetical protein